jgi:hypothetical protein
MLGDAQVTKSATSLMWEPEECSQYATTLHGPGGSNPGRGKRLPEYYF